MFFFFFSGEVNGKGVGNVVYNIILSRLSVERGTDLSQKRVCRSIGDKGVIRSSLESRYLQGHINIDWVLSSPQHVWGVVDIEYALHKMSFQKLFSKMYFIAPENSISQITFGARVAANNKWRYVLCISDNVQLSLKHAREHLTVFYYILYQLKERENNTFLSRMRVFQQPRCPIFEFEPTTTKPLDTDNTLVFYQSVASIGRE